MSIDYIPNNSAIAVLKSRDQNRGSQFAPFSISGGRLLARELRKSATRLLRVTSRQTLLWYKGSLQANNDRLSYFYEVEYNTIIQCSLTGVSSNEGNVLPTWSMSDGSAPPFAPSLTARIATASAAPIWLAADENPSNKRTVGHNLPHTVSNHAVMTQYEVRENLDSLRDLVARTNMRQASKFEAKGAGRARMWVEAHGGATESTRKAEERWAAYHVDGHDVVFSGPPHTNLGFSPEGAAKAVLPEGSLPGRQEERRKSPAEYDTRKPWSLTGVSDQFQRAGAALVRSAFDLDHSTEDGRGLGTIFDATILAHELNDSGGSHSIIDVSDVSSSAHGDECLSDVFDNDGGLNDGVSITDCTSVEGHLETGSTESIRLRDMKSKDESIAPWTASSPRPNHQAVQFIEISSFQDDERARLVAPPNYKSIKYMGFEYGGAEIGDFRTTKANLGQRMRRLESERLPDQFQAALAMTRGQGTKYPWMPSVRTTSDGIADSGNQTAHTGSMLNRFLSCCTDPWTVLSRRENMHALQAALQANLDTEWAESPFSEALGDRAVEQRPPYSAVTQTQRSSGNLPSLSPNEYQRGTTNPQPRQYQGPGSSDVKRQAGVSTAGQTAKKRSHECTMRCPLCFGDLPGAGEPVGEIHGCRRQAHRTVKAFKELHGKVHHGYDKEQMDIPRRVGATEREKMIKLIAKLVFGWNPWAQSFGEFLDSHEFIAHLNPYFTNNTGCCLTCSRLEHSNNWQLPPEAREQPHRRDPARHFRKAASRQPAPLHALRHVQTPPPRSSPSAAIGAANPEYDTRTLDETFTSRQAHVYLPQDRNDRDDETNETNWQNDQQSRIISEDQAGHSPNWTPLEVSETASQLSSQDINTSGGRDTDTQPTSTMLSSTNNHTAAQAKLAPPKICLCKDWPDFDHDHQKCHGRVFCHCCKGFKAYSQEGKQFLQTAEMQVCWCDDWKKPQEKHAQCHGMDYCNCCNKWRAYSDDVRLLLEGLMQRDGAVAKDLLPLKINETLSGRNT